jgi:ribosomal protein S18 acetylase RimI-like enzyme
MRIEAVSRIMPEHVDAFARLLPQQSQGARHPTAAQLSAVVEQQGNTLLIARDDGGRIVGTLTLMILVTPGATFGFVEDVVVDKDARRQGIGEALVRECLRLAAEQGANRIELHSGNHRPDAIRLYQRVGFKKFETNVWRFLTPGPPRPAGGTCTL